MPARTWPLIGLLLILTAAAIELAMGREPWCRCGTIRLWANAVNSAENSQQVADWYTPSHIVHGLLFYAALALALPRVPLSLRALIALAVEAAWEVAENSSWIIERYRAATIALDYYGDSVVNSVSDIGAMMCGFWLARRLPPWASVVLVVVLEVFAVVMIRDNLTLNILMLLYPLDAIRRWQSGA